MVGILCRMVKRLYRKMSMRGKKMKGGFIKMNEVIINKTEKANSFEFGKAGNRFKVYFEEAEDLKKKIDNLKEQGFDVEQAVLNEIPYK